MHSAFRKLVVTTLFNLTMVGGAQAQGLSFPPTQFPQPGTFCGPFSLCQPELPTRDTTDR